MECELGILMAHLDCSHSQLQSCLCGLDVPAGKGPALCVIGANLIMIAVSCFGCVASFGCIGRLSCTICKVPQH